MTQDIQIDVGNWLNADPASRAAWVSTLKLEIAQKDPSWHPVIKEFKRLIEKDVEMYVLTNAMIAQVSHKHKENPAGDKQIENYEMSYSCLSMRL